MDSEQLQLNRKERAEIAKRLRRKSQQIRYRYWLQAVGPSDASPSVDYWQARKLEDIADVLEAEID